MCVYICFLLRCNQRWPEKNKDILQSSEWPSAAPYGVDTLVVSSSYTGLGTPEWRPQLHRVTETHSNVKTTKVLFCAQNLQKVNLVRNIWSQSNSGLDPNYIFSTAYVCVFFIANHSNDTIRYALKCLQRAGCLPMTKMVLHSGCDCDAVSQKVLLGMQDPPEHVFLDVLHRVDDKTVAALQRMQEASLVIKDHVDVHRSCYTLSGGGFELQIKTTTPLNWLHTHT